MDPECKKQLEIKDKMLLLKDEQVKTLESSLSLKNEQINTLESSLKIKDDKIKTLEKTNELREDEIGKLTSSSIDNNILKEKYEKIQKLEKELEILNGELFKSDEELEGLELENERLRDAQGGSTDVKIVDFTHANISKSEILEKMKAILPNTKSRILIITPKIEDLQELDLYEDIASSVNMRIACSINPGIEEHSEFLEEYESLGYNLKNYPLEDKYALMRDGEELLYGVVGESENNNLVIHTKDRNHIKLLSALPNEVWIRSRKV